MILMYNRAIGCISNGANILNTTLLVRVFVTIATFRSRHFRCAAHGSRGKIRNEELAAFYILALENGGGETFRPAAQKGNACDEIVYAVHADQGRSRRIALNRVSATFMSLI